MKTIGNPIDSQEIIEKYFSDPAKQLTLKKDDLLLEQGEENHRVFYVLKGKLSGYLPDKNLREPVFEATPSSFVGVYSFFSKDHQSYTQVVATEAAVVSYYDGDPWVLQAEESEPFLSFLFRMVVLELRSRQRFAAQMATERQEATNKLIQTEKLATLGQLSAGLAHELNNTIGSLSGNLRQLETDIQQLLMEDKSDRMRSFFMRGLELGQQVSSRQAREARQEWDQERGVPLPVVKKLARANIHPGEVRHGGEAEEAAELWELGYLLHDLQIAAQQAAHVVNSIKSMGISQQSWSHNVDVNQTLNEALTILAHVTKPLTLELELAEELPTLEACHGELVQVWVNLMKNAAESLRQQPVPHPTLRIGTAVAGFQLAVTIEDNGVGIPTEILDKIYLPNFTTKVEGLSLGLGLGLTIVQRIVAEHEGDIRVISKPGCTRFTVLLNLPNRKP